MSDAFIIAELRIYLRAALDAEIHELHESARRWRLLTADRRTTLDELNDAWKGRKWR